MKITEMLIREEFYPILEKTFSRENLVELGYNEDKLIKRKVVIYKSINSVVFPKVSTKIRNYILDEFVNGISGYKSIVATIYVRLLLSTRGLLGSAKMNIYLPNQSDEILIWPCNMKFRIFDFCTRNVVVLPKIGFQTSYLKNEIAFREMARLDVVPKIIERGDEWYCEKILQGAALNRLKATERLKILECQAFDVTQDLKAMHNKEVSFGTYMKSFVSESLKVFDTYKGVFGREEFNNFCNYVGTFRNCPSEISKISLNLVLSHGDLQKGNVWVDDSRIYILDWETVGLRSVWYDYFVYHFNLRSEDGLANLKKHSVTYADANNLNFHVLYNVLIAEEILYRLRSFIQMPEKVMLTGLRQFTQKIAVL
jgi:hypothetical protein